MAANAAWRCADGEGDDGDDSDKEEEDKEVESVDAEPPKPPRRADADSGEPSGPWLLADAGRDDDDAMADGETEGDDERRGRGEGEAEARCNAAPPNGPATDADMAVAAVMLRHCDTCGRPTPDPDPIPDPEPLVCSAEDESEARITGDSGPAPPPMLGAPPAASVVRNDDDDDDDDDDADADEGDASMDALSARACDAVGSGDCPEAPPRWPKVKTPL